MKKLVVWYNPKKNVYYYRVVRGIFYETYDYSIGSINSYGHVIVLVVPINDLITKTSNINFSTIKHNCIHKLIFFLRKID